MNRTGTIEGQIGVTSSKKGLFLALKICLPRIGIWRVQQRISPTHILRVAYQNLHGKVPFRTNEPDSLQGFLGTKSMRDAPIYISLAEHVSIAPIGWHIT